MKPETKILITLGAGLVLLALTLYSEGVLQIGGTDFQLEPRYWADD